jgi:hypothetical protein
MNTKGATRRLAAALIVVGGVAGASVLAQQQQSLTLLAAVRDLGPISGWRCAQSSSYVYDPNREHPDPGLLADRPEALVLDGGPGVGVDSVEVDLHTGDAVVSAHASGPVLRDDRLVYVLSPGRLRSVTFDDGAIRTTICNAQLGDWKIIGEHNLG